MSDLISREEALGCFEALKTYSGLTIREQLRKLMPVEPQEWIPVSERLPNEDCECWLTLEFIKTGNRVLYESHYDATIEKFYNLKCLERQGYKLIAWKKKHMPSPYKGV